MRFFMARGAQFRSTGQSENEEAGTSARYEHRCLFAFVFVFSDGGLKVVVCREKLREFGMAIILALATAYAVGVPTSRADRVGEDRVVDFDRVIALD